MKALTLIFFFAVTTFTTSFASNSPVSELSIINSEKVELAVVNVLQKDFFQVADFNTELDALEFVTRDYVNYIQIYDANGKLAYQLPVMSNKLKISRKMFEAGAYKIAFLTKNNKSIQFTNLTVN